MVKIQYVGKIQYAAIWLASVSWFSYDVTYDDVIIHKLQYATTWLVEHIGGEGGKTSRHGAEREEKKEKSIKKKNKKIKLK